jgi:hypothetical protein
MATGDPPLQPQSPDRSRPTFKLARWCAVIGWFTWALSVGLLSWQHRAGVLHPAAFLFALLLCVTLLAALVGTTGFLSRMRRGPRRRAAAAWGLACFLPLGLWAGQAVYTLRLATNGQSFSQNLFANIAGVAVASLMEGQAQLAYPHRLESQRLVMFYDDRVTEPHKDLEAMDRHVAALEAMTGKPLRARIHWVRGEVFGRRHMAIRGLVLGSSQSPADWETADHPFRLSIDRHELAHAVIHQLQPPDADAPTLLIEGWAEAHAGMTSQKRAEFARDSRSAWRERTGAGPTQSYLRELTGPERYHRVDGPVYSVGGALAEFVLQKYGTERFLKWYFACRPGRFEEECLAQLGIELDALEPAFWAEVERLADSAHSNQTRIGAGSAWLISGVARGSRPTPDSPCR